MAHQWFVERANKRFGPFSAEQLRKLASSGQIRPADRVQKEGMTKWVAASQVKGLFPDRVQPQPPVSAAAKQPSPPPSPPITPNQPVEAPAPTSHAQDQRIAAWVFGSVLMTFFLGVFLFAPKELPEFKQRMLAFSSALLAGLFGFFFTGQMHLELKFIKQAFGELGVKATGGAGLFVLVLAWWLSPLAPVKPQLALKPIQYFADVNQISVLAEDVGSIEYSFDGKIWRQAQDFTVKPQGFEGVEAGDAKLDPEERLHHTKVFIKYRTKNGTASSVKEFDYDPNKSYLPESVATAQKEAQESLSRAMADVNKTIRLISNVIGDYNTFYLTLEDKKLSRADISRLGKSSQLMELKLIRCTFEDSDLSELEPVTMLRSLSLSGSTISDEGLKFLAVLRSVSLLDLSNTRVTDQGIVYLKKMHSLKELNLDKTQVTGTGFASSYTSHYKYFSRLSLRGSKLNDEGAKYLGATKGSYNCVASEFDLGDTSLTDTGLRYLESCNQFRKLKIDGTKVTAAGVESLKKKFPHLKLEW